MLLLLRPLLLCLMNTRRTNAHRTVFNSLYIYPAAALVHAVLSGYIYYSFPFIALIMALGSNILILADYQERNQPTVSNVEKSLYTTS